MKRKEIYKTLKSKFWREYLSWAGKLLAKKSMSLWFLIPFIPLSRSQEKDQGAPAETLPT